MKSLKAVLLSSVALVLLSGLVYAGVNWSTVTGGAWYTPNDATATAGQPIVIGSGGGANAVASSTASVSALIITNSYNLAYINALTPSATGQIVFCTNCTMSPVCISTSVVAPAFTVIASTGVNARPLTCQ